MDKVLSGLLMNSQKSGVSPKHTVPIFPRAEAYGRGWVKFTVACGTIACMAVIGLKGFGELFFKPLPRPYSGGRRRERVA